MGRIPPFGLAASARITPPMPTRPKRWERDRRRWPGRHGFFSPPLRRFERQLTRVKIRPPAGPPISILPGGRIRWGGEVRAGRSFGVAGENEMSRGATRWGPLRPVPVVLAPRRRFSHQRAPSGQLKPPAWANHFPSVGRETGGSRRRGRESEKTPATSMSTVPPQPRPFAPSRLSSPPPPQLPRSAARVEFVVFFRARSRPVPPPPLGPPTSRFPNHRGPGQFVPVRPSAGY